MLYTLDNSKPIIKFLHSSNDSLIIDNENVRILAIIAFALHTLYFRYSPVVELLDNDLVKVIEQISRNIDVENK
ncbi:MAG TPA: hypothetical protein VH796_12215 [Nitrososphaeraceae archaeon]|jgi:hypothetical protein